MSIDPREGRNEGYVVQKEARIFHSSGAARYFIRGIADQLSEEDPELMMEFFIALEIANAALVSWLIEDKAAESSCLRGGSAESREFQLAVERLKVTLAAVSESKRSTITQGANTDFHKLPEKGITPDGKA